MSVGVEEQVVVVRNGRKAIVVVMLAEGSGESLGLLGATRVETPAAEGRGEQDTAEATAQGNEQQQQQADAIQEEN